MDPAGRMSPGRLASALPRPYPRSGRMSDDADNRAPRRDGEPRELAGGELVLDFPADAVARFTLNNPEKRNPLSHAGPRRARGDAAPARPRHRRPLRRDHRRPARRSRPATTSARSPTRASSGTPRRSSRTRSRRRWTRSARTPSPVVAAINGHCLGGGLELAVRCDLRLCAAEAKLGMPPAKLGLIYGHTGLERFIDCIGVPRTKELFLTGRVDRRRAGRGDRPRQRGPPRRRDRGRIPGARFADRRQRAALDPRQQVRDRDALRSSPGSAPSRSTSSSPCASRASPPRTSARASAPSARSATLNGRAVEDGPMTRPARRAGGARPSARPPDRRGRRGGDRASGARNAARTASRPWPGSSSASRSRRRPRGRSGDGSRTSSAARSHRST